MGAEAGRPVELRGTPASPGLAAGPLLRLAPPRASRRPAGSPLEEDAALRRAIAVAAGELDAMVGEADEDAAGILAFQLAFLEDATLTDPVFAAVAEGVPAEQAWRRALDLQIADLASAEDEYFRGRAADIVDLRERVLDRLAGRVEEPIPAGRIVVAEDLAPSRFLAAAWEGGGLVLLRGSATSHVALLARSRGVPVLVGVGAADLEGHQEALLDAEGGLLVLDPDAPARRRFEERRSEAAARQAAEAVHLHRAAATAAGERVLVMINIAGPDDLAALDPAPYDGIGLVRTEFLFHGRHGLPGEEEQYRAYRRILEWAGDRPVTIRTLDAGGDKPVQGLTIDGESNPFLGVRGVRLTLRRPDVFRIQLRALARAACHGRLKVMVPMVTLPEELAASRALFGEALAALAAEGVPAASPPIGMMVEVPAAALMLADYPADFFSIGSNDLIQYLAAASRDEPELAALSRPMPALWRLLREVASEGARSGREVGLCGDLAGDASLVPALLDCGLRSLSMPAPAVPSVKAAIARLGRPA